MHHSPYRLYGRQKSKALTLPQQELYTCLLPNVDVDIQELSHAPRAVLEIGFGSGEHLVDLALKNPDTLHIGCEPFVNGVASILVHMDEHNIKNVRIHHADVRHLYTELPDGSFDAIYLLYPDPWPKKRHWKRRFVQSQAFKEMHRLLKPSGMWFIATDHESYQIWVEEHLKTDVALTYFDHVNEQDIHTAWQGFVGTRYQAKALREGRKPRYYMLRSKHTKAA